MGEKINETRNTRSLKRTREFLILIFFKKGVIEIFLKEI